jgi:Mg/Co/Ni transporter MgtE
MVSIPAGVFVVAVDVGMEGLLRRIGIDRPIKTMLQWFHMQLPSKFILWDDVEAIDLHTLNIQLSKTRSRLNTLHPSDLADIIEDMGASARTQLFSTLDEEIAADVLEEMEWKKQIQLIESLPVEKAADVLEKMPANEAADLMDNLEEEKAEQLLHEMDTVASEEVRELLEYPENKVGSLMTTNVLAFRKNQRVEDVLQMIREEKPHMEKLYLLFVLDEAEILQGTFTLRDLLIADPNVSLESVMHDNLLSVNDNDRLDSLSELVSKYNMLAVPVTNDDDQLEGMVVIDDIVDDLLGKRRTT